MTTFINRRGIISDKSLNDGHHSSRQDGPSHTGSSDYDHSSNRIEIPYHGSCPRCHHLHTSVLLAFPLDPSMHTRFKCEDCSHQMFGLGRTSTQTTLASIESTRKRSSSEQARSPSRTCFNSATSPSSLRIEPVASSDQSDALNKLSTISEANSPAPRSRSTSDIPPQSGFPPKQNNVPTTPGPGSRLPIAGNSPPYSHTLGPFMQTEEHKTSNLRRGYGVRQWAKKRLFGRSGALRLPGLGLQVHVKITGKPSKGAPPEFQTMTHNLVSEHPLPTTGPDIPSRIDIGNVPTLNPHDPHAQAAAFPPRNSLTPISGHQETLSNRANLPEDAQDILSVTKEDRIKIKRKAETLKRKALEQRKCACTDGCHCMNSSQRSSFTSNDRKTSPRSIQIPSHPLYQYSNRSETSNESRGFPPSGSSSALAGVGIHLSTELSLSSSAENSSTVAESSRAPSRLSQNTAVEGSAASVTRRPESLGRSSSTPVFETRRREIHYPDMAQRPDLQAQVSHFAREADAQGSSIRTHDGDDSNRSEGTESSHCPQDPIADRAISTSLANLSDPSQTDGQFPIDGAPETSPSIPTFAAGDSQELTPRPLSFNGSETIPSQPTQAAPETLSTRLQNVITDGISNEQNVLESNARTLSDNDRI